MFTSLYFSILLKSTVIFPSRAPIVHTIHVAKNSYTVVFVLGLVYKNLASPRRIKQLKDMDCIFLFLCPPEHLPQHSIRRCLVSVS